MGGRLDISAARSTIGGRSEQEDASEQLERGRRVALAVCDGVGSSPRARECAEITARAAVEYLSAIGIRSRGIAPLLHGLPRVLVDLLSGAVTAGSVQRESATTLAAVVLDDRYCWTVTVGDSRAFLVRDGSVVAATRIDSGDAYRIEGLVAEDGAALERWISAGAPPSARIATVESWRLLPGDTVVLATDGVTALVPAWELARLVTAALIAKADVARTIIDVVVERADRDSDNATVTAVTVPATRRTP